MRAFEIQQVYALLNSFGETLNYNGVDFLAIKEFRSFFLEGSDNSVFTHEYYFTARTDPNLQVGSIIVIDKKEQIIYHIDDDLSGVSDYFYRSVLDDSEY